MRWHLSHCCSKSGRVLADRHYSRQTPGASRFVAPGSPLVLLTERADAVWATLYQEHADHAWPGAWVCTIFRNESAHLSSELIREAAAATRAEWGDAPVGLLTFVDAEATKRRRSKRNRPGHCFRLAGFEDVGVTQERGRIALMLRPEDFPPPRHPRGTQPSLFDHIHAWEPHDMAAGWDSCGGCDAVRKAVAP